jgi:hypothetical protein
VPVADFTNRDLDLMSRAGSSSVPVLTASGHLDLLPAGGGCSDEEPNYLEPAAAAGCSRN